MSFNNKNSGYNGFSMSNRIKNNYKIIRKSERYKRHITLITILLFNNIELVKIVKKDYYNNKIYFNKEIKYTSAMIKKVNDLLIEKELFKERIKNFKELLNNSELRNYKNFKVLEINKF